ncbi:Crp/Fnr family transcriptional regulator [Salmonirosea aquatica]
MIDPLTQGATRLRGPVHQFAQITDEEWSRLAPHLFLKTFKKQENFVREGVVASEVGLVVEGAFRQFYNKDGEERTTDFFFEDQLVGAYMSCVTGKPSPVTIEALSEAMELAESRTVYGKVILVS